MSDFAPTTLFVVPSATLASTGSTQDLTPNQLGIFGPDYAIVNSGTIAGVKYFFLAQGRTANALPELGSKRSDNIDKLRIIDWYKTVAEPDSNGQVTEIAGFHIQCGEFVNLTLRGFSKITEAFNFNGFTKTVSVQAPCCDCNGIPCADISGANTEALVDALIAKVNAPASSPDGTSQMVLSTYYTAERSGTGAASKIVIKAKPLPILNQPWEPYANLPDADRFWFRAYVYVGAPLSTEDMINDRCDTPAGVTITQRASLPSGSSAEVSLLEKQLYSYQTSRFKHIHKEFQFNPAYETAVVAGTWYDLYYLTAEEVDEYGWNPKQHQKFRVIVAFPTGNGSNFETVLTAALGAPVNKSGVNITTTTSTSTSSTTTTSTTVLIP